MGVGADGSDLGLGDMGMSGGSGPTGGAPGGGLGDLAGQMPGNLGMPSLNAPPDFGGGGGAPGGGDASGASMIDTGGFDPSTIIDTTAPQSQAPTPGTDLTSIGGTRSDAGPTGPGSTPAPQGGGGGDGGGGQLQQIIQQLTKAISPSSAQAATAGPSNLSPTLADLSKTTQTALRPDAGPTGPGDIPLPGQDLTSGSNQQTGLEPPGGGLGQLGQSDDATMPGTRGPSPEAPGGGLGDLGRQYNPQLPTTLGPDAGGGEGRRPGGEAGGTEPPPDTATPQAPAGGQAGPTGPGSTAAPQVAPATKTPANTPAKTPATSPAGNQQQFGPGNFNPIKLIGDVIQAMFGNMQPLLSDLAGMTGGQPGSQPWQGKPQAPASWGPAPQFGDPRFGRGPPTQQQQQTAQPKNPLDRQPQTEEQQKKQREQDLGKPGDYIIDDKGNRVRVDAQGKPIPEDQQGADTGTPAPPKTRFNLMHGPVGQNITNVNSSAGNFQANKEAAPHFQGFINDLIAAGAPGVKNIGGFNIRNIAGTNHISQHSYGNAIDIDQTSYPVHGNKGDNPPLRQWIKANPQQYAQIANKWGISNGGDFGDWGHFEWNGGGIGAQTAAYPPQPLPEGQNRPPRDVPQPGDTPAHFANVRNNNPGAMNMGPSATKFGAVSGGIIKGNNNIAHFPTPVHGAAANMDNLANRGYVGMTIGQAMHRWSGGGRFDPGPNSPYNRNTVITREMTQDPNFMIPFVRSIPGGEAPGKFPMSDAQWQQAFKWYQNGGVPPGEQALSRGAAAQARGSQPQRIRGLDLLPGGAQANRDGGRPIQFASRTDTGAPFDMNATTTGETPFTNPNLPWYDPNTPDPRVGPERNYNAQEA